MKIITIFLYLITYIKGVKIYQCARYRQMGNQCLNQWVDAYGNIKVDLWNCGHNQYCYLMPKKYDEENLIGVCANNKKMLYDGDECSFDSECASFNCSDSKCAGFPINEYCNPNQFQCENNLVCKKDNEIMPYGEIKTVYKCKRISQMDEACENDNECDINLLCGHKSIYTFKELINKNKLNNIFELINKTINYDDYILLKENNKKKICIERASLENGLPTPDPQFCKSGDAMEMEIFPNYTESICVSKKEIIKDCNENNTCTIKVNLGKLNNMEVDQECMFSAKGNPFCPLAQREQSWKKYLANYQYFYEYLQSNETQFKNLHIPVYKNTFNNYYVSKSFWYYQKWNYIVEGDSCTKQYIFLQNEGIPVKYSLYFLIILYSCLFF